MKTLLQICVLGCMLILIAGAYGWEFNDNGSFEGWTPEVTVLDVNDGRLVVTVDSTQNAPRITAPTGSYDTSILTGVYAKMRMSVPASAFTGNNLTRAQLRFINSENGMANVSFSAPEDLTQDWVMYLNLSEQELWQGTADTFYFDLPRRAPNDFQIEFDWIRWEGELVENESFEYWDSENDKIAGWTASAAYAFPNPMEPDQVNSRDYAAVVTSTGNSEAITQDIRDGLTLPQGQRMLAEAAVLVPADAAGTEVTVHVAEQGQDGQWSTGTPVAVDTLDGYAVISSEVTLALNPADRTGLRVEVSITSPAGAVVYLDDIFVAALPALREPAVDAKHGWPMTCVKLSAGQEISIDGEVTPEEYQGAQAIVINAETANSVDPTDPNFTHAMFLGANLNKVGWHRTPLDDYNGTYYVMWDDENFYIACSVQDDIYTYVGSTPNKSDALQFTMTAGIYDTAKPNMYIPTVAPADAAGNLQAQSSFNPANFFEYEIFQNPEVLVAGKVDPDTQDWTVELKIPWVILVGDFPEDMANGDADGNGRDVFPPVVGDVVGFSILAIDEDDGVRLLSGTHAGFAIARHGGPMTPNGKQTQDPLTFVAAPDTTSGLVAHWKLDEDQGTVATDSSGNGNDATFQMRVDDANGAPLGVAPAWVAGKLGGALKFDGLGGYLAAPDSASLDISGELSITAWINGEDWPFPPAHIVRKLNDEGVKGPVYVFRVQPDTLRAQIGTSDGNVTVQGATVVPTNEWVHVALVCDGSEARVYLNGQLDGSSDVSGEILQTDGELRIGLGDPAGHFIGMIDDARVYNRALSPVDLAILRAGE